MQKYKKFLIPEFTKFFYSDSTIVGFYFPQSSEKFSNNCRFLYDNLANLRLAGSVPSRLARLRKNNPEAFYYWVRTSELLSVL